MAQLNISRAVGINASPEAIRGFIEHFPSWRLWSPFENLDPNLERDYSGPERGVGSTYRWSGNKQAGAGGMTITDVSDSEVKIRLEFLRPFKGVSDHTFSLIPQPNAGSGGPSTMVTWTMSAEQRGLMGLVAKLFMPMDKLMGGEMTKGLTALRKVAEAEAA